MKVDQAIERLRSYAPEEQIDFLLDFAHELTIGARDTYAVGEEGLTDPARMRRINEVQHRILGFIIALRRNDARRYPEDTLVRIDRKSTRLNSSHLGISYAV